MQHSDHVLQVRSRTLTSYHPNDKCLALPIAASRAGYNEPPAKAEKLIKI